MSNSRYRRGTVGTLAALGTIQGDAAAILSEIVQVTAANGTKGVRLETPVPGGPPVLIFNTVSGQDLKIWPAVGGTIDYAAANDHFALGGRKSIILYPYSATQWYTAADTPGLSLVELAFLDGVTAGTGLASKALVLDANGDVTMPDLGSVGFGGVGKVSWDPTDANANKLLVQLPTGGGVDVPVIMIGQAIEAVDMAMHDGITEPTVCLLGVGAVATGPRYEFRKARGTATAPTVVTSADDLGQVDFYACVAAGEWVRSAQILVECTGTVATTRGPGVITIKTATDAAPSVLTSAMTIAANQVVSPLSGFVPKSLSAAAITTTRVLTIQDSGGVFSVAKTSPYAITLPTPAQGIRFKFLILDTGANAVTFSSGGAHLFGQIQEAGTVPIAMTGTTLSAAASGSVGDWLEFEGIDATHYLVTGSSIVASKFTIA
jgi:hypothetical protein